MTIITKVFVVGLVVSLVMILGFSVLSEHFNEYDVELDNGLNNVQSAFETYSEESTNFSNDLSDELNSESSGALDQVTKFITSGYNVFVKTLQQLPLMSKLFVVIQTELGIPQVVTATVSAIIVILFVVAIALILMRLGVL